MNSSVVPFPTPQAQPSREELAILVREMAVRSENIRFDAPHFQEQMAKRNRTMRQVLEVLRAGEAISGPTLDKYGDWRIKLRRNVAGSRVQVVVAVRGNTISVVTVI